ncbi:MAG: hypothetical protein WAW85_14965 [Gordonia sp. (in: high G+C Gram-positive bacteria)]|uniref:hypothetical protein n=1 Tax=Gordonia sp. (in: high G+C Gram-positive bacteria) TaxID=84139 RepID=UPI003BB505F0
MEAPLDSHGILRRTTVLRYGLTDDHLATEVSAGELVRLGYGAYLPAQSLPTGPTRGDVRYRYRCVAFGTADLGKEAPVLSHQSAAAVHRLPLLKADLTAVHLLSRSTSGGHKRHQRHIHAGLADPETTTTIDDIRVTSLARTAVDLACLGGFAQALTALDGALRLGATADELTTELSARRRKGITVARRALAVADGSSESVGESWSRAQFILANLPLPALQRTYQCRTRQARVDFDWSARLVGEFDGHLKYGRQFLRDGETATDIVVREKDREDQLRELGLMVVRWLWRDLESGAVVPMVQRWLKHFGLVH